MSALVTAAQDLWFLKTELWLSLIQSGVNGFIWIHPVERKGRYLSIPPAWVSGSELISVVSVGTNGEGSTASGCRNTPST